jgi:proteic killer suppression protein
VIVSFGDAATEEIYDGKKSARVRRFGDDVLKAAERKLDMIEAADRLEDLKISPGNRLEALKGGLRGFHSIRVNDQWRVVFRWEKGAAAEVRVTDYH